MQCLDMCDAEFSQDFFYRMRNYGASVANAVLLVVSAVDGVCQQTQESIGIADSLNVPVVIAINKIDILQGQGEDYLQSR